jgi:hypothetical protein
VEASRQSRVCGGAANEVMCAVFRVLMEVRSSLCVQIPVNHLRRCDIFWAQMSLAVTQAVVKTDWMLESPSSRGP